MRNNDCRRLLALLLAALAQAGTAGAAPSPLRDAKLLLDGRVRPGTWTALQATVEASDAPLLGELSVRTGPARYVRPLSAPAATRHVTLVPVFVPPTVPIPKVAWSGDGAGGAVLEPAVQEVPAGDLLVGVDPARAAGGRVFPSRETLEGGRAIHWVALAWADVRDVPEVLDALDGVVFDGPDPKADAALEAHVGAWLGRGGRLFRDAASVRRAAAGGWGPVPRLVEGIQPLLKDLLPREGMSPRRAYRGRIALGILLALGAVAAALVGWHRLSRAAAAAVLGGVAVAGAAVAVALVPPGSVAARGVAVKEIVFPEGAAGRSMAESVEGVVAVDAAGACRMDLAFPPRARVSVAADAASRLPRDPVEIVPAPTGGWTARLRLAAGGRLFLRFSRPGPAGEGIRARVDREGGRPVRIVCENTFDADLRAPVLVSGGAVYPLDAIAPSPGPLERGLGGTPMDWAGYLRSLGPPGDPGRARRAWWGPRLGGRTWLLADHGETPMALEGADLEMEWQPMLVAVRIGE